ncbi:hypothetical protein QYE76_009893 [Lolium multiflorum]|uniref:Reverse transcriptase Ty1/copia-type domain-containing protein n=1 Tax=Lolium multiflorum TaxID=4521 RepID=A0AAD8X1L9_LOLMU|nr:hypothetical protein QYE76_009893 [Lolium multiflorum]
MDGCSDVSPDPTRQHEMVRRSCPRAAPPHQVHDVEHSQEIEEAQVEGQDGDPNDQVDQVIPPRPRRTKEEIEARRLARRERNLEIREHTHDKVLGDLMTDRFEMSMMGEMKFFLGFEIKQLREGTFINQAKYLQDMLKRFKMTELKGVATPMVIKCHLALDPNGKEVDQKIRWRRIKDLARDDEIEGRRFWCLEQEFSYKDIYEPMRKVRPMQAINVDDLAVNNHFEDAIWVTGRMGLQDLMKIQCDYSPELIKQFFATLAIKKDAERTMGLLPIYSQVLRFFRATIAPSGGNNDALRGALVDLMHLSLRCARDSNEDHDFSLDVMDFIFNEIHDAMVSRTTMPYAPYIQLLINNYVAMDEDLSRFPKEKHSVKKAYKKKPVPHGSPAHDSFMGDARTSGFAPARHADLPAMKKQVRKLSWF